MTDRFMHRMTKTILIIDDDVVFRKVLHDALSTTGLYTIAQAANGEEGAFGASRALRWQLENAWVNRGSTIAFNVEHNDIIGNHVNFDGDSGIISSVVIEIVLKCYKKF